MSSFKDFCKKRQAKKLGLDAPPPARTPAPLTRKSPEDWTWAFVADRCGESGDGRVWRAARTHAASLACGVWAVPEASRPRSGGCWWVVGARAYVEGAMARSGALAEVLDELLPWDARPTEVVLIGPEMDGDWALPAAGRVRVRSVKDTLDAALARGAVARDPKPSGVALFQAGFGTLLFPLAECWLGTLAELLALDVPVFSAHYAPESEGERVVLCEKFGAKLLVPGVGARDCPLGHACPREALDGRSGADWAKGPSNARFWWVKGSDKAGAELFEAAPGDAALFLRRCAHIFAPRDAGDWAKLLVDREREQVRCGALLLAEATTPTEKLEDGSDDGRVEMLLEVKWPQVRLRAGQESEIPNFKASYLGRFPLVLADFWASDHLLERSRSVDAFFGTRARGTLTLKRR